MDLKTFWTYLLNCLSLVFSLAVSLPKLRRKKKKKVKKNSGGFFYSQVGTQTLSLSVHPEYLRGVECLLKPLACSALANWGNGPFTVIFPVCLKCLIQSNCSELFSHVLAVKMNTSVRTSVFSTCLQVYMRKTSWPKRLFKITQKCFLVHHVRCLWKKSKLCTLTSEWVCQACWKIGDFKGRMSNCIKNESLVLFS